MVFKSQLLIDNTNNSTKNQGYDMQQGRVHGLGTPNQTMRQRAK